MAASAAGTLYDPIAPLLVIDPRGLISHHAGIAITLLALAEARRDAVYAEDDIHSIGDRQDGGAHGNERTPIQAAIQQQRDGDSADGRGRRADWRYMRVVLKGVGQTYKRSRKP